MTQVRQLSTQEIRQHWSVLEPMLNKALAQSKCNDYNIDDVYQYLILNQWRCYVSEENNEIQGTAAVVFQRYPRDVVAYVCAIGGRMLANTTVSQQFFDLLKTQGAARLQGAARPAIVRLWRRIGIPEKYTIVERAL